MQSKTIGHRLKARDDSSLVDMRARKRREETQKTIAETAKTNPALARALHRDMERDRFFPKTATTPPEDHISAREIIAEGAKAVGGAVSSATLGALASAIDGFIKAPIEIIARVLPGSRAKESLEGTAEIWGKFSGLLEDLSPNPTVFKVAKIGADIAGIVIGTAGLAKVITNAGKVVTMTIGKVSAKLRCMIAGTETAVLARDVAFVTGELVGEGAALAEGATSISETRNVAEVFQAKELKLSQAEGAAKAGLEELESLRGGSSSKALTKVNNMYEFFETKFGQTLKGNVQKTHLVENGCPVYKVTEKTGCPHLDKGDLFYLDKLHGNHIEVFNCHGSAKAALNLDGTLNSSKTAATAGREIKT
jgi:hypothetical protein